MKHSPRTAGRARLMLALCPLLAAPAVAQVQAVAMLEPAADAFLCGHPSRTALNYGGAGALAVAPVGAPTGEFQSVLRFDVSAPVAAWQARFGPGAWTIVGVDLRLWAAAPLNTIFSANAPGTLDVRSLANDSWVEGEGRPNVPSTIGITFATLPQFLGPGDEALGTFSYPGGTGAVDAALAAEPGFIADIVAGGLVGVRVVSSGARMVFNSRDFGAPAQRPMLTITVEGPCRADLTTGAIPGQPGYLTPNGVLSNDDFFAYLIEFSAGNLGVADLTGTAVAGQPGYGLPNGVLNNDDFFFFLTLFAAGC